MPRPNAATPSRWQTPILATQATGGGQQQQQQWQTAPPVASTLASDSNNSNNAMPATAMLQHHHQQQQWHLSPEITVERVVNANAAAGISRPMIGNAPRPPFSAPLTPGGITAPMTVAPLSQHPQSQPQPKQQQQSGDWFWS